MTWSVNEIDLMTFPLECNSRSSNRDPAFSLLFHVVHHCVAVVNLARQVQSTCIVKHALCHCCFSCINMGNNADVTDQLEFILCLTDERGAFRTTCLCFCLFESCEESSWI